MGWEKGLISVGGDTQGQVLKYLPYKFTQAPDIGSNSYQLFVYNEEHPLTAYGNDFSWSPETQITNHTYLMFPIYDTNKTLLRYLTVKYGYRAYNDGGRKRLNIDMDVGYTDLNQTYTHHYGITCRNSVVSSSYLFNAKIHICCGKYNNADLFGIAIQIEDTLNQDFECNGVILNRDWLQGLAPEEIEGSPEYGEASEEKGGYNDGFPHGSFDDSSDTITYSSKPTLSVGNSGFVHAYVVNEQILQAIGTALFPRIESQSFTGIPEAIDYLTMVMFFNKRTDYIMDMLILPITVPSGNATRVKVGGSELVVQDGEQQVYCMAYPVTEYYVDFDCGSISIPEYWCNFLDFTGTRFKLFLPALGYVDLQGEFINGGEINVKYRFNIVDGSFMCVVTSTSGHSELNNSLIAQYSGVWAMHIPITGQDYTNKISGLISSVGSVAAGGLMGGGIGAVASGVSGLANTAMQKPQTTHANGYNASSSFLTHRKPYLIIERQSSQFSTKYPSENGLPCYVARQLSSVHGFTIIDNPVLNIACSDVEYNELVQLLKNGIIL